MRVSFLRYIDIYIHNFSEASGVRYGCASICTPTASAAAPSRVTHWRGVAVTWWWRWKECCLCSGLPRSPIVFRRQRYSMALSGCQPASDAPSGTGTVTPWRGSFKFSCQWRAQPGIAQLGKLSVTAPEPPIALPVALWPWTPDTPSQTAVTVCCRRCRATQTGSQPECPAGCPSYE